MNTGSFPKVCAPNKLRIGVFFIVLKSFLDASQNRGRGEISNLESWHKYEDKDYARTAFQAWVQAHRWRPCSHCGNRRLYSDTGLRWPLGMSREESLAHTNPQLRAKGVPMCSMGGPGVLWQSLPCHQCIPSFWRWYQVTGRALPSRQEA